MLNVVLAAALGGRGNYHAAHEIDADPKYAADFSVSEKTERGIRTVTIAKKGASYPGIRLIALVIKNNFHRFL